jgi:hypothetical protein
MMAMCRGPSEAVSSNSAGEVDEDGVDTLLAGFCCGKKKN